MKTIGILTSGGDAPGMNAMIWAAVKACNSRGMKVYGIKNGFQGLLDKEVFELTPESVEGILDLGGTKLGTARCQAMYSEEGRDEAAQAVREWGMEGIIVGGGDGSFMGARCLSERGIPTVGIPCTIDNDLGYTDNTIGFDTACNTATDAIMKVRDTMMSHNRVAVVEVMGRHCGDIALTVGLVAGADYILIPEVQYETQFDFDKLAKHLMKLKDQKQRSGLVVIAEGVEYDVKMRAYVLRDRLKEATNLDIKVSVLGHMQRGGYPTVRDRRYAMQMTDRAVQLLYRNIGNRVVGIKNNRIIDMDIMEAAEIKKTLNVDLYNLALNLGSSK